MATYPNEAWPSDQAVELLDGTTDAATGLPYIAKGVGPTSTPTYEVQYNRREHRLLRELAVINQGRVVDEGNLRIGVYPIDCTIGGQRRSFAGVTGFVLEDNATTCIWIDATGNFQSDAAFPTSIANHCPLATVTATDGVVSIADDRPKAMFHIPQDPGLFTRDVQDKTAVYTLTAGDSGRIFTNYGAPASILFTLPTGATTGLTYTFVVATAQAVNLIPGLNDRILYGSAADHKKVYASTVGHSMTLVGLSSGDWAVIGVNGTWSVEA